MPASYNLSDLVDLCDIYGNNAGELLIDYDNHAYLFHDDGVWLRLTEEFWKLTPDERKASIGINPGKLTCSDGEVWGKRTDTGEAAPILPFPFTAAQLLELDERTGGTFSEHIYCGNETDERISEIARLNPKAAELARALIYGELPPQEAATPAPVVAAKEKAQTWWEICSPYIVEVMQAGQYATFKNLYRALEAKAGPNAPFDRGEGANLGSLFVREIAQAVSFKTVQNQWKSLRELARK